MLPTDVVRVVVTPPVLSFTFSNYSQIYTRPTATPTFGTTCCPPHVRVPSWIIVLSIFNVIFFLYSINALVRIPILLLSGFLCVSRCHPPVDRRQALCFSSPVVTYFTSAVLNLWPPGGPRYSCRGQARIKKGRLGWLTPPCSAVSKCVNLSYY